MESEDASESEKEVESELEKVYGTGKCSHRFLHQKTDFAKKDGSQSARKNEKTELKQISSEGMHRKTDMDGCKMEPSDGMHHKTNMGVCTTKRNLRCCAKRTGI